MRYLVAADGETLDAPVARRFGHAAAHLLVDADDGRITVTTGDVEAMPAHGLGRFAGMDLDGLITGNIGPHAWEDVQALGWPVYIVRGKTVGEAVRAVAAGEIPPADGPSVRKSLGAHDHHGPGRGLGHGPGHGMGLGRGRGLGHGGGRGAGSGGGHHHHDGPHHHHHDVGEKPENDG